MMKLSRGWLVFLIASSSSGLASDHSVPKSNGIAYPTGWQEWATIAVSHRNDNNTMRVILGNDVAVKAARNGQTRPWPDGAILGKVVWKEASLQNWPEASAPGEYVHAEFMFKDADLYSATHGWGWARWVGLDQQPYDEGMDACVSCHTPVRDRDWAFTDPARMPR